MIFRGLLRRFAPFQVSMRHHGAGCFSPTALTRFPVPSFWNATSFKEVAIFAYYQETGAFVSFGFEAAGRLYAQAEREDLEMRTWLNRRCLHSGLLLTVFLAAISVPVGAAEPDREARELVQLRSMMAPAVGPAGTPESAPVTLFLQARKPATPHDLCRMSPRIVDALLRTLHVNPIPIGHNRAIDPSDIEPLLTEAANQALGRRQVASVSVVEGARNLGRGAASRLPFTTVLGCSDVSRARAQGG